MCHFKKKKLIDECHVTRIINLGWKCEGFIIEKHFLSPKVGMGIWYMFTKKADARLWAGIVIATESKKRDFQESHSCLTTAFDRSVHGPFIRRFLKNDTCGYLSAAILLTFRLFFSHQKKLTEHSKFGCLLVAEGKFISRSFLEKRIRSGMGLEENGGTPLWFLVSRKT